MFCVIAYNRVTPQKSVTQPRVMCALSAKSSSLWIVWRLVTLDHNRGEGQDVTVAGRRMGSRWVLAFSLCQNGCWAGTKKVSAFSQISFPLISKPCLHLFPGCQILTTRCYRCTPQIIRRKQTEDNLSSVIGCDHIYYVNEWQETPRLWLACDRNGGAEGHPILRAKKQEQW